MKRTARVQGPNLFFISFIIRRELRKTRIQTYFSGFLGYKSVPLWSVIAVILLCDLCGLFSHGRGLYGGWRYACYTVFGLAIRIIFYL